MGAEARDVVHDAKRVLQLGHARQEPLGRVARPQRAERLGQVAHRLGVLAELVPVLDRQRRQVVAECEHRGPRLVHGALPRDLRRRVAQPPPRAALAPEPGVGKPRVQLRGQGLRRRVRKSGAQFVAQRGGRRAVGVGGGGVRKLFGANVGVAQRAKGAERLPQVALQRFQPVLRQDRGEPAQDRAHPPQRDPRLVGRLGVGGFQNQRALPVVFGSTRAQERRQRLGPRHAGLHGSRGLGRLIPHRPGHHGFQPRRLGRRAVALACLSAVAPGRGPGR